MSTLLFSLRGVPEDEADEIRELLTANNIDYYETSAGNWGISMPALWVNNNEQVFEAQKLLNQYHQQRAITQREIYEQLKKEGGNRQSIRALTKNPIRLIVYIGAIVLVLYASIKMLFEFGL